MLVESLEEQWNRSWGRRVGDWGLVVGLCGGCGQEWRHDQGVKIGTTYAVTDLAQPKEGPLGSQVEHLKGVNRNHLPTGITKCRSKRAE